MSKGKNQKLKLTYLTKIMLEKTDDKHGLTISQIMEELEKVGITAERKSIYTDFADMTEKLGIEIAKVQRGRKIYYHVEKRQFELSEVNLIIDALQTSKILTEKKSKELVAKVKSFVSMHQAEAMQRQVFVNGRIKTMNESAYDVVDTIYKAMDEDLQISFKYNDWIIDKNNEIKRDGYEVLVSPWALVWVDEAYYLAAYDAIDAKIKYYQVDKMGKVDVRNKVRDGEIDFVNHNIAACSKQNFGIYGGELKRVIIEFPKDVCDLVIGRFGKDVELIPVEMDRYQISINIHVNRQFIGWIFSLGEEVKVIGPEDVLKDIKHASAMFALQYR